MRFARLLSSRVRMLGIPDSEAARLTGLTAQVFRDIANDRYPVPICQQIGMLVCLGMSAEHAIEYAMHPEKIAGNPLMAPPSPSLDELEASDPFVFCEQDRICISDRVGTVFSIGRDQLDSAEKALQWVHHLCKMPWMTLKHFRDFTRRTLEDLRLPTDPP